MVLFSHLGIFDVARRGEMDRYEGPAYDNLAGMFVAVVGSS